jgi:hypothetical protein
MAIHGASQTIHNAVMQWPQVESEPHQFGGTEYRIGQREIGHTHGDNGVDMPFPRAVRDELWRMESWRRIMCCLTAHGSVST